jgi:hypothetical protein
MGMSSPNGSLEEIVSLALGESRPNGTVKTSVVSLHLSQMREWGVRGGNIQIKSIQDFNNIRKDFIEDLLLDNYVKHRLESAMNHMVARGEVMWVVQPSESIGSGYAIDYFVGGRENPDPEYYVFYKESDPTSIECVVTQRGFESNTTSIYVDQPSSFLQKGLTGYQQMKWVITFIDESSYISWTFDQKPQSLRSLYYWYASIKNKPGASRMMNAGKSPEIKPNPFSPNLPFAVCKNSASRRTDKGLDDFTPLKDSIEDHNELLMGVGKNLKVFYTPTLVTSRDASSVLDSAQDNGYSAGSVATWAGQNGFFSALTQNGSVPFKMPQVIGNIKEGERFGYVQVPDVVSGDHNLYIRSLRELIHWTLGGVDPLGISASATFGEIKSLFGRIENTAFRKADIILGDKGLCKLLVLILVNEENKAKIAMTKYVVYQYLNGDPSAERLVSDTITDAIFRDLYFFITDELKIQIPGLPPLGEQGCSWRYTKDVFERTTRDQLDASIVYRNAREDGISQSIALSQLYPNMKDDEIRDSMSGFSPRVVNNAMAGISSLIQLHNQLMQMPSPENPELPWALTLGTDTLIQQGVKTLQKELAWTNPVFRDEIDYGSVNDEINETLQQIRTSVSKNVQPIGSTPSPIPSPISTTPRESKPGRQSRSGV